MTMIIKVMQQFRVIHYAPRYVIYTHFIKFMEQMSHMMININDSNILIVQATVMKQRLYFHENEKGAEL